ncbi:hypothetical protein [Microbacterium aurantiacum]|uniref:Uncharacterized protein n=1 Tax=Microbacterium aurantiacum TaxID=162393 RepID=A0ABT8FSQ1_9MICO|nr:hypothetical protein [Microbacterium aurantiacum]MDN4464230.1 hypothetical protein [Microbacterium aurantiacum]
MPRRSVVALLVSGAVALAITGAVLLVVLPPRAETAEDTAQAFAEALIAADGTAAVALVADASTASAIAAAALDGASAVDTAEVVLTEQTAERTTFDLTLGLAGDTATSRLVLVDVGEGWRVADGMWGTLRVETTHGDAVRVGGTRVPAPGEVLLLPGRYPVTADPADLLDGATETTVFPGTDQDVAIEAIPNEAALEAAQGAIADYAAACTVPATGTPANCGMRIPWPADLVALEELRFRIDRMPRVEDLDAGTFVASGGVLVVTARGTDREGAPRDVTYRSDTWTLRGSFAVGPNGITLTVW